ncbi:MAG: hypothetical protein LQ349_006253, partial [Xanthoria aureola]
EYVGRMKASGLLWSTRPSKVNCRDPRYSQVLGVARTILSELLLDFATSEIDVVNDAALQALINVFLTFQTRNKEAEIDPDQEFALSKGVIYTPRYYWDSVMKELSTVADTELPRTLEIGRTGLVQGDPVVLAADEIQVEPCAVGLNFKDILVCIGLLDAAKEGIGLEGARIVRNIVADLENFKNDDRVIVFEHGCFSTRLAISAKLCARITDELGFEEAAMLPCVHSTVIHSLLTIGGLQQDQILATVSSDDKKQYLIRTFGIPQDKIFNSRNDSFHTDVKRTTKARGELLHGSWKCVSMDGKMLEIGKRDFVGRGLLSTDLFEANRAFFVLNRLDWEWKDRKRADCKQNPVERKKGGELTAISLLKQFMDLCSQGKIPLIKPMEVFEAAQIIDALKYMQKGHHIGKIVVMMPRNPKEPSVTAG